MKRLTYAQILRMPTISQGHTDNLIKETKTTRVWLSRLTVEDGMPYNDQITVERVLIYWAHGKRQRTTWKTVDQYKPL